jgi:hypothetical protein
MLEEVQMPPPLINVSCTTHADCTQPWTGQPNRDPRGKPNPICCSPASLSNSTEVTCHGATIPNAASNIENKP